MADPWADFRAKPAADPAADEWAAFRPAAPAERGVIDKLTGRDGGDRYQTWPERAAREILAIPQKLMTAPGDAPPGSEEFSRRAAVPAFEAAAVATPLPAAMRAGERAIAGEAKSFRAEKPQVPTTKELAASGGQAINAAKQSGLEIAPGAVGDYSRKVQQELFDAGVHPSQAPSTYQVLKELENAPPDAVFTAANLQSLRETLGSIAQNFNPNAARDQLAASRAIKGFDQFLPAVDEASVVAGTPAATQKLFQQGRGDYAAAQRSNDITGNLDRATTGILERAEGRAQAANSGRNLDNTIRSKAESFLEKPKEVSGFSEAELAALEHVRDGGAVRNSARYIGNLLGGGGGIGQSGMTALGAAGGMAVGNLPGAIAGAVAPAAIGSGAKAVANALARRDLRKVDELLRMRSPLYQQRVENPLMVPTNPEAKASIVRLLMAPTD